MSIEHFENWEDSVQVKVILYVCMYIIVESHNNAVFSKISANFQCNTIENFAV